MSYEAISSILDHYFRILKFIDTTRTVALELSATIIGSKVLKMVSLTSRSLFPSVHLLPHRFLINAALLASLFLLLPLAQVFAADITVSSTCSLANAITAANSDTATGGCSAGSGADVITLTGDVTLSADLPEINSTFTIQGAGHTITGSRYEVFEVVADSAGIGHLTLNNLTVTDGDNRTQNGGAAHVRRRLSAAEGSTPSLIITNSRIHGNLAGSGEGGGNGGGVGADPGTSLTIRNSAINNNTAVGGGGGVSVNGATATIENSVIGGNTASGGSGGGGIHIRASTVSIKNSTIHGNDFGGLHAHGASTVTLTHVTIANQTFRQNWQINIGLLTASGSTLKLRNSLIAGNLGGDCIIGGTLSENVGNLIGRATTETNSCSTVTVAVRGDPKLGALHASNAYYPLQSDSPAINAANAANCLPKDQRGATRGSTCDIGAIEYVGPPVANFTATVDANNVLRYGFDASGSTGSIDSYQWDFGDGATGSGQSASHTYAAGGDYRVTLTVANSDGSASAYRDLAVETPLTPAKADFDFAVRGYRVAFTSAATGSNLAYGWDVDGDGDEEYWVANPVHDYKSDGAHTVMLTVSNVVSRDSAMRKVVVPSKVSGPPAEPTPIATPAPNTCLTLPASIRVSPATGGVQCQRVFGAAISDAAIRQAMTDAVDVWSWVRPNTQVCFAASGGTIKFIDTTPIPRVVYDLPAYRSGGMTCVTINGPGTVVLLPGPPAPVRYRPLAGCIVTTRDILKFRDAPGGALLQYTDPWGRQENGLLPPNVTLTALERTADWFKVDYHGTQGWISARHVTPQGNCG